LHFIFAALCIFILPNTAKASYLRVHLSFFLLLLWMKKP